MRFVFVLIFSLIASFAGATKHAQPDRPATPAEQVELARYDQELLASQHRLKTRIAADAEVQQMLDLVFPEVENTDPDSAELSAAALARYTLAQQDELAGLIWANQEYDRIFASHIRALDSDSKAAAPRLLRLIARWKTNGSAVWKILDALVQTDPMEQKRLLSLAIKSPLHSQVTQRARKLALRYFEMIVAEPAPKLREGLAIYRPDDNWIRLAMLGMGGIDVEALLATSVLESVCDLENARADLLSAKECQSVLLQTQLVYLMTPSEMPAENFKEPELSAFIADQQLIEQVQAASKQCEDRTEFIITILRALNTSDWRVYLRKVRDDGNACKDKS